MPKVGDVLTVKSRTPKLSKVLLRNIGFEYYLLTLVVESVFNNTLLVAKPDGSEGQIVSKRQWQHLKKTGKNYYA